MRCQGQSSEGMVIALEADGHGRAYLTDYLDAGTGLADAEALASEYLLVTAGVELGEAGTELELLPVDHDRAVGALLALDGILRQVVRIDAQEVAHAGLLQAEVAGHPVVALDMHDVLAHGAEYPLEHVVEMHTDVRGHSPALVLVALPGGVVPVAPGGDVGQVYVVDLVRGTLVYLFLKSHDRVVETELENVVGLVAGLLLYLHDGVYVVGIEHRRLLADDVGAEPEAVAHMGVVQIVGGAYRQHLDLTVSALELGAVTVEQLLLSKKSSIGEETVHDPDTVEAVVSRL